MEKAVLSKGKKLKVGWATGKIGLDHPAHRRTLLYYAKKRDIQFEVTDDINKTYDIVYVSQGADITHWVHYKKGKLIYEFSDAYLAESEEMKFKVIFRGLAKFITGKHRYLRFSYRKALEDILKRADAVLCGTLEQGALIKKYCNNVHYIFGFHEDDIKKIKKSYSASKPFNLVWEGFPSFDGFVTVNPVLEKLKQRYDVALHLVTDIKRGRYLNAYLPVHTKDKIEKTFPFKNVYLYEWNNCMFSNIVTECDLGIIPIPMNKPFWVGKPANKLLLFWRMGIPTLTSATPSYKKIMDECGLDMTCNSPEEWAYKLEKYLTDENARRNAGMRAKEFAEAEYGEEKLLSLWDSAIASAI